jgi:4-aminobutyrate aminotransferase-like enzyme
MTSNEYILEPADVPKFETRFRKICTPIPALESIPILKRLKDIEIRSMQLQPPIIWSKARDINVFDRYGNKFIDWSSGCLVSNAGHGHPNIKKKIIDHLNDEGPMHSYCFYNEPRIELIERLSEITPPELNKVFLLSTGGEACEVALRLARTHGIRKNPNKRYVISFEGDFHGWAYGSLLMGDGGEHIDENKYFIKAPFPSSLRTKESDRSFDAFLRIIREKGITDPAEQVAALIGETYQAREAKLLPADYMQSMRKWCDENDIVLVMDEVQSGFGRTGRLFAFEHFGIVPDMITCGKAIAGGLPLSAVIGKSELLDQFNPGEMSSSQSSNPVVAASALGNIKTIIEEGLVKNSEEVGNYLGQKLKEICNPYHENIEIDGVGLVWNMQFIENRETLKPDPYTAFRFCLEAIYRGNMIMSPVGDEHSVAKFCPPLTITKEAIDDAIFGERGLLEALDEVMSSKNQD